MIIQARKLLNYQTKDLWSILNGQFKLVFDDGDSLDTNDRMTLYSSYFWDFHRLYPGTALLKEHHVQPLISKESLSSKTHIQLLTKVYWATLNAHYQSKHLIRNQLVKLIYNTTNNLYNDMVVKTEASVTSIDILDFIEINDHPAVANAFEQFESKTETIEKVYNTIIDVIKEDPTVANNSLVKAVKSKMVNTNQVLQCVGPRGMVAEVDGSIIATPVNRSYTQGMRTLFNVAAEARTAAKALYFSETPLQDSEYFARRLQLVAMVVERLHRVDCGSTDYLQWFVKPPIYQNDKKVYAGDLEFLVGKFYLDEATNTLKAINKHDTFLNNTHIKLRSVLFCKHPDPHGVCEKCFGLMSENIADSMNLGHICAATMTQQTTQSVLSTKHLDASASADPIKFTPEMEQFFIVEDRTSNYVLKPALKNSGLKIVIDSQKLHGFTDILKTTNLDDLDPSRISSISEVGFVLSTISENTPVSIKIEQYGRNAILTSEFIKYAKEKRWTINSSHAFVFDMCDWDYDQTIFRLPDIEYSYAKHSKRVAEIIESKIGELNERNRPESPVKTLRELFDTVNSKINVNLALLEVVIYAMMTANKNEGNMYLARNSQHATLGVRDQMIKERSLSAAFGFKDQIKVIYNPQSFFQENRPDHPLDVLFCPAEVLKYKGHR